MNIQWTRSASGSTEIVLRAPLFFGLVVIESHFLSDIPKNTLTGYAAIDGPLAPVVAAGAPRLMDGKVLANISNPFETMPIRPGDREDGSLREDPRNLIAIGQVARWSFLDFDGGGDGSRDAVDVGERSWAATKFSYRAPDGRGSLEVWFSAELQLVLREEVRLEGEVQRSFSAVSLERGDVPEPSIPLVQE